MSREITALRRFCTKLRSVPAISGAIFVFLIEANHCWVRAKDVANAALEFKPCEIVSEKDVDGERIPGIWMTHHQKDQMNKHTAFFLKLEIMHILAVNHKRAPLVTLEDDPEAIIRKFTDQFKMYRQKIYVPADSSKEASKIDWTGKSLGTCDDMMMALMIALWWGANFLNESGVDKYKVPRVNVVVESHPEYRRLYGKDRVHRE